MNNVVVATEFELAVRCCRWTFAGEVERPLDDLVDKVEWMAFLHTVRRHRIQALAWNCLGSLDIDLPSEISRQLAADASSIAQRNLRAAIECRALLASFTEAGIPLLFVKGLTLGALAFPDPFLKMGWDIDVLVPASAIAAAASVLEESGYRLTVPARDGTSTGLTEWHSRRKESVWHKPAGDFHLELHSRLADNMQMIPDIGIGSDVQQVEVAPGIALPTLGSQELFAYLCVHGASSAWFRLKWLADFAALLHRRSDDEIERLYAASQRLGAGRAAGQALLLAEQLFGTGVGDELFARLKRDRRTRWLAAMAFRQLAGPGSLAEPTERRLGTAGIHLSQLLLLPGWRFKAAELQRQVRDMLD